MQINITARHFKASTKIKEFAKKKVKKLEKYYDNATVCDILLSYEKLDKIAEISFNAFGQHLRVVEKSDDILKSLELGMDKLERQLKKHKAKQREHGHVKLESISPVDDS